MKIKKRFFIFGTRPEAIKLAPVILEFKKDPTFEVVEMFQVSIKRC